LIPIYFRHSFQSIPIDIIYIACRILYPGYFTRTRIDKVNLIYYFGQEVTAFFEALSEQITLAIRHECRRHNMACVNCEERGQEIAINFMNEFPRLRTLLAKDIRAAYEGDPAAKSYERSYSVIPAFLPYPPRVPAIRPFLQVLHFLIELGL